MKAKILILMTAGAALMGLAACGGENSAKSSSGDSAKPARAGAAPSGRYAGEITQLGIGMEVEFRSDGEAVLTMTEGGESVDLDCVYESGESRIALSCPGSSGISLTRLDGGDLEADMDGVFVRLKKN